MLEVVAALILEQDKFLICQRGKEKSNGLLWEFVGGKVEKGESKEKALIRECQEELSITLKVNKKISEVYYDYPDFTIDLTLFETQIVSGEVTINEHNAISWITTNDIDKYEFCPADKLFLGKIKELYSSRK